MTETVQRLTAPARQKAPAGLGTAGRRLWASITGGWTLDERESALLAEACRTADLIDQLEELLHADGLIVAGSNGQPRLSQVVAEVRQQRLTLGRLLDSLSLPAREHEAPRTSRRQSLRASARWQG